MSDFVVDVTAVAIGGAVGVATGFAIVVVVVVAIVIAIVVVTIGFRIVVIVVFVFVVVVFIFVFVVVVLGGFVWTIVGDVFVGGVDVRGRTVISGHLGHSSVKVDVWHEVGVTDSAEIGCFR